MNLYQAIQKAISDNGVDILKDRRLVSLLSDFQAFGQLPYAANMLRQIYANGYGTKIHKLYQTKDKTETAAFLSELRNKLGFDVEMLGKVLNAFSLPVPKGRKTKPQQNSKSITSQNRTDLEIVYFDGRNAYKDEYGGIYSYPNCEIFYKLDNPNVSIYSVRPGTKIMYKCAFVSYMSNTNSRGYSYTDDDGYTPYYNCNKSEIQIVSLPDSITIIPDYCFSGCRKLSQINIPNSVISIGKWAFEACNSLRQLSIPSSVHTIGFGILSGCSSLNVSLPSIFSSQEESICYNSHYVHLEYV